MNLTAGGTQKAGSGLARGHLSHVTKQCKDNSVVFQCRLIDLRNGERNRKVR